MNKRLQKGTPGYLRRYRIMTMGKIGFFVLLILLQIYASRMFAHYSFGKFFLVSAIITVLPMANIASPFLASLFIPSVSQEIPEGLDSFASKGILLFELLLTNRDGIFPLDAVFIRHHGLYILARFEKRKEAGIYAYLREALSHVVSDGQIHFFYGREAMEKALSSLAPFSKKDDGDEKIKELLLRLSL